jgi:lipoprotein-anchoring transpeptidase ErfK/SrfK
MRDFEWMGKDMRKIFLLLALALMPVLATGEAVAATAKPTEQQQLLIKKKKAEEARKAAEARKAKEKKAADARKAKEKKAAEALKAKQKKATEAKKREERLAMEKKQRAKKAQASASSQRRDCDGFLDCLMNKPRRGVQTASTGSASRDRPTGENIRWASAAKYAPGSIVVNTPERALYLVTGDGEARRYKVGVGKEGFQWSGTSTIVNKTEWPTWRPPQAMIKREAAKGNHLPAEMEGGPGNPLGARALYIGGSLYRIHGTNSPGSIGGAVSSGCIRMMNSDVIDLYERVSLGAKVYVTQ